MLVRTPGPARCNACEPRPGPPARRTALRGYRAFRIQIVTTYDVRITQHWTHSPNEKRKLRRVSTQIRPDLGSLSSISSKRIRERRNRRRKVLLEQRRERSEHDSDNANPNDDESNDIVLVGGDEFLLELVGGVGILLELVLGSALPGCVLAIDLVLEKEGVDIVICERGTNMSAYASPNSIAQQQGSQDRSLPHYPRLARALRRACRR